MGTTQGESDPKRLGEQIRARREALGYWNQSDFAEALAMSRSTIIKAEQGRASEKSVRLILQWLDRAEGGPTPVPVAPPEDPAEKGPVRVTLGTVRAHGVTFEDVELAYDGNAPAEEMKEKTRAIMEGLGIVPSTDADEPGDEPGDDGT